VTQRSPRFRSCLRGAAQFAEERRSVFGYELLEIPVAQLQERLPWIPGAQADGSVNPETAVIGSDVSVPLEELVSQRRRPACPGPGPSSVAQILQLQISF